MFHTGYQKKKKTNVLRLALFLQDVARRMYFHVLLHQFNLCLQTNILHELKVDEPYKAYTVYLYSVHVKNI